jgi:capsular polysaccharide biosynthesis protein
MEFSDYWHAIVRRWWLIAIFGLVGLVVPFFLASPPKGHVQTYYRSTSVIGSPPTAQNGPSLIAGGITTAQVVYYASTDAVMEQTSSLSGLNLSVPAVRSQISLVVPGGTGNSGGGSGEGGVVDVSAVGATAAQALTLDNAFVKAMNDYTNTVARTNLQAQEQQTELTLATVMEEIATNNFPAPGLTAQALDVQVNALQSSLAGLVVEQPGSGFEVVQAPAASSTFAVVTGTPTVIQNHTLRIVAGLLIGLVLGALAAVALWLLDRRLKTAKRAQAALGYPVVAEIPSEASDSTETYRMLWLSVFREPLPLPPAEQNERWYGGEDPVLEHEVGSRSVQAGRP